MVVHIIQLLLPLQQILTILPLPKESCNSHLKSNKGNILQNSMKLLNLVLLYNIFLNPENQKFQTQFYFLYMCTFKIRYLPLFILRIKQTLAMLLHRMNQRVCPCTYSCSRKGKHSIANRRFCWFFYDYFLIFLK